MKYVVLHNVRSAYNTGAIFRTADGAGVQKMYLTGYTPLPIDRFGREQSEILKTSLGATKTVDWEQCENIEDILALFRDDNVKTVAVEQHSRSISYRDFTEEADVAYIFGNEIDGISDEICTRVDTVVKIPMLGKKESLNVSVAAGIILFN